MDQLTSPCAGDNIEIHRLHTLQILRRQQDRAQMILLNELADLGCHFRAFEAHLHGRQRIISKGVATSAHHEQLTKSPVKMVNSMCRMW